jgi:hypothetical protein
LPTRRTTTAEKAPSSARSSSRAIATALIHGIAAEIRGELPLGVASSQGRDASLIVHAPGRPVWAFAPADPARRLFIPPPNDADSALVEAAWTAGGEGIRIRYAEGADFWIDAAAQTVWMEWRAPLSAADAAYFLCDPVMAFVLRRRGALALHASAVAFGERGVLFTGTAGAGKSLTAGACVAAGAAFITDDVAAIEIGEGGPRVRAGPAALRVWDAGAEALLGSASLAVPFSATWDKRVIAPAQLHDGRVRDEVALALICVLVARTEKGTPIVVERVDGRRALEALVPVTAANYLHDPETRARELGQLASLLGQVALVRVSAPDDAGALGALPGAIRRAAGG